MSGPPNSLNTGPPVDVFPEEIKQDNYVLNELKQLAYDSRHASTGFNTLVADDTSSLLDLPSTYPFNSERYELIQEGTVDDTDFTDASGKFELTVNGNSGDAHELRARKRLTYLPNYELLVGMAFYMQNQLATGQKITLKIATPDGTNGYISEITSTSRRSFILNGSNEIDAKAWGENGTIDPYVDVTPAIDETRPQVLRSYLNWYGDGRIKNTLAYAANDSSMRNDILARCANRGEVATEEINLKISIRLECTEATTANTINVLSFGAVNRGDDSNTNRRKPSNNFGLGGSIDSTSYTPVLAARRRSGFEQIPTQLNEYEIIPTGTMEVAAVTFPEGTTDASGWDVPPQQDPENTAVEQTTSITTFPTDANGEPDGRLIDIVVAGASGNKGNRAEADVQDVFYEDEELVFLAQTKSDSNASVDLLYTSRQEW